MFWFLSFPCTKPLIIVYFYRNHFRSLFFLTQSLCSSSMLSKPSTSLFPSSGQRFRSTLRSCMSSYFCPSALNLYFGPIRESLYEGEGLPQAARDSAALLASKVYYYLGEYEEALSFALGAGSAFVADSRAPGSEEETKFRVDVDICLGTGCARVRQALRRCRPTVLQAVQCLRKT